MAAEHIPLRTSHQHVIESSWLTDVLCRGTKKGNDDTSLGKTLMGHRKVISLSIALFLVLTLTASLVLAEACFCGKACLHSPRAGTGARPNSLFHARCPGTLCESCNLEETQTLKAANSSSPVGHAKTFDATMTLFSLDEHLPTNPLVKGFEASCACRTVPPPPIYLKNLSLLR
jgi:hypothetical protein